MPGIFDLPRCRRPRVSNTIESSSAAFTSTGTSKLTERITPRRRANGGAKVIVHVGRLWLRILDPYNHELVREHELTQRGSRRTAGADRPKQTPPKIEHLVDRIARHGPACSTFARSAVDEYGATAARMLFGVLDLVSRYGPESVERACEVAAQANSLRYRFLRAYLQHHATTQPLLARHKVVADIGTYTKHLHAVVQGELL